MKAYFSAFWQSYKYLLLLYTVSFWMYFVYDDFRHILRAFENAEGFGTLFLVWGAYYVLYLIMGTIAFAGIMIIGFIFYLLLGRTDP